MRRSKNGKVVATLGWGPREADDEPGLVYRATETKEWHLLLSLGTTTVQWMAFRSERAALDYGRALGWDYPPRQRHK